MRRVVKQALACSETVVKTSAASPENLRLPPLPSTRDLLKLYRLRAKKQMSQNFLLEHRITDRIAKAAGHIADGDVCEVGPGPGSITRSILYRNPGRLILIEKDPRFIPFLDMLKDATGGKVQIILGDVLSFDMNKAFREELRKPWQDSCPNIHLIGNLPFSVSTPLIIRWLRDISLQQSAWSYGRVRMTLTFQKEVAERMVAEQNENQRCRLSVMCQNWCDVKHGFNIPGTAFIPPPDVDVGVVTLRPKIEPIIKEDFYLVEKVVRQVFCFRQKRCARSIGTLFPKLCAVNLSNELVKLADVNPDIKPMQLTIEEFDRIIKAYKIICDKNPSLYKFNHGRNRAYWDAVEKENQEIERQYSKAPESEDDMELEDSDDETDTYPRTWKRNKL